MNEDISAKLHTQIESYFLWMCEIWCSKWMLNDEYELKASFIWIKSFEMKFQTKLV